MSEARDIDNGENDGVSALSLSAFLSSRVCHDLINPVGAIGSGLDVLDDPDMEGTMREAALDLIRTGARKAIALLSYARLAYGAAGAHGAEIGLKDARDALEGVFDTVKADLDWRLGEDGAAPKDKIKVALILAYAAADCVPRGGTVVVAGDMDAIEITATGRKALLQDDLLKALGGDARGLAPKFTPALIASQIAAAAGGAITAAIADETVSIKAAFSR